MKFPNFLTNNSYTARAFVMLVGLFLLASAALAQTKDAPTAAGPNPGLEQCRNGGDGLTKCADKAWVSGSANATQSHYAETQYIPYRFSVKNTVVGDSYTVTIGYDYLKSGLNAIDYLGTYNNTITDADPCSDIFAPLACPTPSTAPIPHDSSIPVPQPAGQVFTIWGGTITSVGPIITNQPGNAPDSKFITISFTATATNVVIAYGGHIAWSGDWGQGQSASSISGAPYHTFILGCTNINGCGSLDVQLMTGAAVPAGLITIIKIADTPSGTDIAQFDFTATAPMAPSVFQITDNNAAVGGGGSFTSQAITSFGPTNAVTIRELNEPGWSAESLPTCTTNFAGTFVSSDIPTQPAAYSASATVYVNAGGSVTCTFTNSALGTTAAPASVAGRVTSMEGTGLRGVKVTLYDITSGEKYLATTNSFGNYSFSGLNVQDFYRVVVSSNKYVFRSSSKSFTLLGDMANMNFVTGE